tara:strand:- start:3397 stop:5367 length:1971 start_codon:yes stop_codon:yes gene_type:complete
MAIPTSPSVVVLENDVSIYTPNINSSVIGIVGFSDKGPVNEPTLITSQENLLRIFGKPSTTVQGQAVEGALEVLEATNQLVFVRGINASDASAYASAAAPLGTCPAVSVESYNPAAASSIFFSITDNAGATTVTATVDIASSTDFTTSSQILRNAFNPDLVNSQNVFFHEDGSDVMLASKFAGSGASMTISGEGFTFKAIDIDGDVSSTGGASTLTVHGFTASNVNSKFYSVYPGAGYNLVGKRDGTTNGVSVEINNKSTRDQVVVNNDGGQVESFNAVELSPSSLNYLEFVLNADIKNNQSEYIYADVCEGNDQYDAPNQFGDRATSADFVGVDTAKVDATPRFLKIVEGTYALADGRSGATDAKDLIGSASKKTGIYALDDDGLNISIGIIPGVDDQDVQNAFITLAETSKNFLALVAPPQGLQEVQDAIDWINGSSQDSRDSAINSSYAAVYWPHVQVFNTFAGAEQFYDPTIFAARQCAFTDAVSDPWFAPAGFNRGRLTKPTNIELNLNQGDRDALYDSSINPILNDPTTGITIFGQRTTQRAPTALDRVNVRRLMIFLRKVLQELGKPFQFEPNDQFTWELVEDAINPFLDDLVARRALIEAAVKCDSTTNTPARVDRNELWVSITIKPTKAAESIVFEVNLTSQSATVN